ncbi:MAG: TolC family protein [Muribaculaceae bacterium]|nr:TolC family protein [Muribaculaceae bacterium]
MKKLIIYAAVAVSVIITACSGVKNLQRPQLDMPAAFTGYAQADSASVADLEWWRFYADSTLCRILDCVVRNNRDLLASEARIEELRKLYGVRMANMLPQIGGNVYANHETNNYSGSGTTRDPEFGLKIPVSWEINLWGSLSWSKKEGKALWLASEEDYRALQVSLIARAAETYFRLVALENELSIVRRTAESRQESMRMAKIRFEGGLTSETVYRQAMVEYSSAASLVPALEQKLVDTRNSLTLLMGEYPHDIDFDLRYSAVLTAPDSLPVGLPSSLLKRRPDVRAAGQRLSAAMAAAGYAYADRFPTFTIGFTPGHENDRLKDFFKSPFTFVVGSVTGPIFDFGRKKRKYEAAVAAYDQARYKYENTVIRAFTEVDTAIEAYGNVRESSKRMMDLRDAAAKYIQLAYLQYRAGTLNYIDVLDAERRYFNAQVDVSNAIRDEYIALVEMYKVLGGGWDLYLAPR